LEYASDKQQKNLQKYSINKKSNIPSQKIFTKRYPPHLQKPKNIKKNEYNTQLHAVLDVQVFDDSKMYITE